MIEIGSSSSASHDSGSADEAALLFDEALALWRGPALAEFAYDDFAQAEIHRLGELRLSVTEDRVDALLRLGRHGELVGQLDSLVAHPITFTGVAVDQVQAVCRQVAEVAERYPDAAAYSPGAIL